MSMASGLFGFVGGGGSSTPSTINTLGSRRMVMSSDYSNAEDIVDVPTFLRKENMVKNVEIFEKTSFEEPSEKKISKKDINIEMIWNVLDTTNYEKYLMLLNNWYVSHKRLPRKKSELRLSGFEEQVVERFSENNFRAQMQLLAIKLFMECDDQDILDEIFVDYMGNKYYAKSGIVLKVSSLIKQIFNA